MQAALLNSNRDPVKLSSRQQASKPMIPIDELDASESETKTKGGNDREFEDEDEEEAFGRGNEKIDLTNIQVINGGSSTVKDSKVANHNIKEISGN